MLFRSVLADFLVQVVDASDEEAIRHYETTIEVLGELGAKDKPMIVALNKIDMVPEEDRPALIKQLEEAIHEHVIPVSVKEDMGMDELLDACEQMLKERVRKAVYCIPYDRSDLVAAMHREGKILSTEYEENGTMVEAVIPVALAHKLMQYEEVEEEEV